MYIVPRKAEGKLASRIQRVKVAGKEVGLLTIATIIVVAPCLGLCISMGQVWPVYFVVGSQTLGAIIGAINFDSDKEPPESCVPRVEKPKRPKNDDSSDWKKAA